MIKFLSKYHRWIGIILTVIIFLFASSGIILNHRNLVSGYDVNRRYLPEEYHYNNWNNGAVQGSVRLDKNRILLYGNVGIWLTNNTFTTFTDFNAGFPDGVDNRKISTVFRTSKGDLFAGTFFGLFQFNFSKNIWQRKELPLHSERIVDIIENRETLLVLSRSFLLKTTDTIHFEKTTLPPPENYDNKIGLFKTMWMIHSGELFGIIGKMFVDLMALVLMFLTLTGVVYFINPRLIRYRKKKKKKNIAFLNRLSRWSLKWHNKVGWTTALFLAVITCTGIFLRPPLLIPIANVKVSKIPFTMLDSKNPWSDKLRRILYDKEANRYFIATPDAIYYSDDNFSSVLKKFAHQPPLSVMGVNVFKKVDNHTLVIGSFKGLFLWDFKKGTVFDYIDKKPFIKPARHGSPIGKNMVSGYATLSRNREIYFDYRKGAQSIQNPAVFCSMPEKIMNQPISLWNLALEIHTARIHRFFLGDFYILIVPLVGLSILFVLISGLVVWLKRYRR